jgi:hypothetical protein
MFFCIAPTAIHNLPTYFLSSFHIFLVVCLLFTCWYCDESFQWKASLARTTMAFVHVPLDTMFIRIYPTLNICPMLDAYLFVNINGKCSIRIRPTIWLLITCWFASSIVIGLNESRSSIDSQQHWTGIIMTLLSANKFLHSSMVQMSSDTKQTSIDILSIDRSDRWTPFELGD